MKHWTGENRLPPEQAEKLMGDYRVLVVLHKIKALQTACQRAGLPVPLDKVLWRETSLGLPRSAPSPPSSSTSTSVPSKANATPPQQPNEDKKAAAIRRRKAPSAAAATAPATEPSSIAPVQQVQVPETLLGWLRLLSPLLMLGLGLVYGVYLFLVTK